VEVALGFLIVKGGFRTLVAERLKFYGGEKEIIHIKGSVK
jgi:hypothetical protein